MTMVYEAKLGRNVDEMSLPDYRSGLGDGPADDFVVCLRTDGSPASKFGDLVWDFTAYHPEQRLLRFYFAYWGNAIGTTEQIVRSRAVRRVTFALVWHRPGTPLSLGTLGNYVTVLCASAQYAEEQNLSLGELFGDADLLPRYAATKCSGWMCETLGSLLGLLANIGKEALGFAVIPYKAISAIKSHGKAYRAGIKQHSPMPTRIYSAFIAGLQKELAAWLPVSKDVLRLLGACGTDPLMGRSHERQRCAISSRLGGDFDSAAMRPDFETLCPQSVVTYLLAAGKDLNVKSLGFVVWEIQLVCKLIIQTFAGMRDDEVCSLPYRCIDISVAHGQPHYVIKGRTTKFNHGLPKRAQWVTNREGQRAIEAAQAIADAIYWAHDIAPEFGFKRRSKHPLFLSSAYLELGRAVMEPVDGHFLPVTFTMRKNCKLLDRLCSPIEEADLKELEQIDPHRAWRSEEDFRIGVRWKFKTHQLRRSLALYAQRSGLVSLPSLRRQLHHITEEMSRYYAKGSTFAKDFIGEEQDHFGLEWQSTQPESSALGYILNVLTNDDTLIGGHANWVQHRLSRVEGKVLVDRDATIRRFRKGEMAYKETVLGGCTKVEGCDQVALNWLSIDPQTVEYRTEVADLEVLRGAMNNVKKK